MPSTPEELAQSLRAEIALTERLMKVANIEAQWRQRRAREGPPSPMLARSARSDQQKLGQSKVTAIQRLVWLLPCCPFVVAAGAVLPRAPSGLCATCNA